MKIGKTSLGWILTAGVACSLAVMLSVKWQTVHPPLQPVPSSPPVELGSAATPQALAVNPEPPAPEPPTTESKPAPEGKTNRVASLPPPKPAQPQGPGGSGKKEPIQDPLARAALSFVGMDAEAEQYWYEAINDLSLSAQERQDLIEDLNEDGLSDPRRPTFEDLPLIVSRLQLLEQIAPDPADKVNAEAFAEAYKDLSNMLNKLVAGR